MFIDLKRRLLAGSDFSHFIKGAALTFTVKLSAAAALFAFNVVVARQFGAEGSGIYFLAWTLINIAITVSRFGFENTVTRYVALAHARGDWTAIRGVYRNAVLMTAAAAATITLLLLAMADWTSVRVFSQPALAPVLAGMTMAIVPTALYQLHGHLLKGLQRPAQGMALLSLYAPVFAVLILLVIRTDFGLRGAVLAFVAAAFITLILGRGLWRRVDARLKAGSAAFSSAVLLRTSLPMLLGSIFSLIILWLPIIVLGAYASAADVGVFSAANRVAVLISFVTVAANAVAGSRIAVLYDKGDLRAVERFARQVALLLSVLAVPVFLLFLIAGHYVMLIFGAEFSEGAELLKIMAAGQLAGVMFGPAALVLSMSGNEQVMKNILLACALLGVLLSFTLIPAWAGIGAAIAVAVTVAAQNILAAIFLWQKTGIRLMFIS